MWERGGRKSEIERERDTGKKDIGKEANRRSAKEAVESELADSGF